MGGRSIAVDGTVVTITTRAHVLLVGLAATEIELNDAHQMLVIFIVRGEAARS